jgi:cytochrome b
VNKPVRVWDLPVRLLHAVLAVSFVSALVIAAVAGDESALFPLHALLGAIAFVGVVLRLAWGFAGSRWARFAALDLRPRSVVRYLGGALGRGAGTGEGAGHNPATSWFLVATLSLVPAVAVTGVLTARGQDAAEDVHEVLAWSMAALAALHVAGVVLHRLRRGECLARGMVTGRKIADASAEIRSARPWSAAAFLLVLGVSGAVLARGYDAASGRLSLPLLAGPLQLRDAEDAKDHGSTSPHARHERDDDD